MVSHLIGEEGCEGYSAFEEVVAKCCANRKRAPFTGKLLALDPGETTGWVLFQGSKLVKCDQIQGTDVQVMTGVADLISGESPDAVVCEDYKVYRWKKDQHTWSNLFTPRLIGVIEHTCFSHKPSIPLYLQMASVAKGFCTDEKLKQWHFYKPGLKHARDAIRHGCYWLLFGDF